MSYQNAIAVYEEVETLTEQMLQATKQQDWQQLAELEALCAQQLGQLKNMADGQPLSAAARKRKLAVIKHILATDREIRQLMSPWVDNMYMQMISYDMKNNLTSNSLQ